MKIYKEVDITFKVGLPFVFFIYKGDELRYIGYTDDLNKKSFSFPFDYDRIAGYYYDFRYDVHDYVDALIIERKPTMCSPRYGIMEKNLRKYLKEVLHRTFPIKDYRQIKEMYLCPDDFFVYNGVSYIKENSKDELVIVLSKALNIKLEGKKWNIQ